MFSMIIGVFGRTSIYVCVQVKSRLLQNTLEASKTLLRKYLQNVNKLSVLTPKNTFTNRASYGFRVLHFFLVDIHAPDDCPSSQSLI